MTPSEAIKAFAAKQQEFNVRMANGIDGVKGDVEGLNKIIKQLQDNPGPISEEDQALLDSLQAAGEALASKVEAVDQLTPPEAPTIEGPNSIAR